MLPLDAPVVDRRRVEVGVRARRLVHPGVTAEIVVGDHGAGLGVHRVGQRMELREVEEAARSDQRGGCLGPTVDVRKPVQRTEARVDDVVGGVGNGGRGVVHVGGDECRAVRAQPQLVRQGSGGLHGGLREVEAHDLPRAVSRPRQGVHANVALEVQQRPARHVADLGQLEGAQRVPARPERVQVVEVTRHVDRHTLVPARTVGIAPVVRSRGVHGSKLPTGSENGPPVIHRRGISADR